MGGGAGRGKEPRSPPEGGDEMGEEGGDEMWGYKYFCLHTRRAPGQLVSTCVSALILYA